MVSKKPEIIVCGKMKDKDAVRLIKKHMKKDFIFKKIFRTRTGRTCITFEEPKKRKKIKRFWKTKKRIDRG